MANFDLCIYLANAQQKTEVRMSYIISIFSAYWGKLGWDGGPPDLSNQVLIIVFLYKVGPDVEVGSLVGMRKIIFDEILKLKFGSHKNC